MIRLGDLIHTFNESIPYEYFLKPHIYWGNKIFTNFNFIVECVYAENIFLLSFFNVCIQYPHIYKQKLKIYSKIPKLLSFISV